PAASENRAEPGRDVIPSPAAQLTVRFVAHELSWIQLTVDDREPFDIMLRAGESYRQRAAERIRLRLGNAGGLVLFYNGRRLVPPGEAGKPVNLVLPRDVEKLLQPPPSMEPQEP
ncbi:MAG: DUF4115 domain-containing protein, partial [Deltaproteobacteria bacterium]|nr:DUF4115 domain-containing protein [Deltaproteobacteria bacterium]